MIITMTEISQERNNQFKKAIKKMKDGMAKIEAAFLELEQDCKNLERASKNGHVPQEMIDKRNNDEHMLAGLFFVISSDSLNEYNNLGGNPPCHLEKGLYDNKMDI